jgi:hypothetical protein
MFATPAALTAATSGTLSPLEAVKVDRAAASILNKTKKPFAELPIHQISHNLAYSKNF